MATYSGKRNPNWKGGRTVASNGYVLVKAPGNPMADVRGYVYEHRLVASQVLGRPLTKREQVHHRNGDKTDNRPENIEVTSSRWDHAVLHRKKHHERRLPEQSNPTVSCACGCGTTFPKFDAYKRPRRFVSGHNATWLPTPRKRR